MNYKIREMKQTDIKNFYLSFKEQGWNKQLELFEDYYKEQENKERFVVVAEVDGSVAGYSTLILNDFEGPFKNKNIPTVYDFNVLIKYRNRGIGNLILDEIENIANKYADKICLGVGIHSGYGSAQRMYTKRGYIFDGTGAWYNGEILGQYEECRNDDDLVLYMIKDLK